MAAPRHPRREDPRPPEHSEGVPELVQARERSHTGAGRLVLTPGASLNQPARVRASIGRTIERTGTMPATATKWTPPTPTMETAHDVRRLSECTICHHLGINLIRGLFKGSLVER